MSATREKELYEAIVDVHARLLEADVELRVAWLNWIKSARRRILNGHNRRATMPGGVALDAALPLTRSQASWELVKEAYAQGRPELAKVVGRYDAWRYGVPRSPEEAK